jgi:hypothetical protein
MKTFLAVILTLIGFATSLAQSNGIGAFKFEKRQGSHKALVIFHTRAFEPSKHRVTKARNYQTLIDGRWAHGTDGNVPKIEIALVKLSLDGKDVSIPGRIYADCFEPDLNASDLVLRFGRNFRSVIITMSGSDGAGSYEVIWRLRKNGNHSRSFSQGS